MRHPAAGSASERATAGRRAGEAARRGEREKHQRHDAAGDALIAFAVESAGRLGGEAKLWLRKQVGELPEDTRPRELARAYKVISCAVQTHVARQLRKASGLK